MIRTIVLWWLGHSFDVHRRVYAPRSLKAEWRLWGSPFALVMGRFWLIALVPPISVMNDIQLAATHGLYRNFRKVHALETSHIHGPFIGSGPGTAKRQDSANWAEIILRRPRIPHIHGQVLEGCKESQIGLIYPVIKCAPTSTHRAITDAHVVKICVDLKFHLAAMTTALVSLLHDCQQVLNEYFHQYIQGAVATPEPYQEGFAVF